MFCHVLSKFPELRFGVLSTCPIYSDLVFDVFGFCHHFSPQVGLPSDFEFVDVFSTHCGSEVSWAFWASCRGSEMSSLVDRIWLLHSMWITENAQSDLECHGISPAYFRFFQHQKRFDLDNWKQSTFDPLFIALSVFEHLDRGEARGNPWEPVKKLHCFNFWHMPCSACCQAKSNGGVR